MTVGVSPAQGDLWKSSAEFCADRWAEDSIYSVLHRECFDLFPDEVFVDFFMAGVAIAQQFGRPYTPTDQAWIESLFGHTKGEWPHLEQIKDPGDLEAELKHVRN